MDPSGHSVPGLCPFGSIPVRDEYGNLSCEPIICLWGIDSNGSCNQPPLPIFGATVNTPSTSYQELLLKLGVYSCAYLLWLIAHNIDIDDIDHDDNRDEKKTFYYSELGEYTEENY